MQAASLNSSADPGAADSEVDPVEPILAGVAHDFGNILAVITNYASLASRRIDDPATVELLDKVAIAAGRAARLNRQLHDLGACGSLVVEPLLVNDFIAEARPLIAQAMPERCGLQLDLTDEPLLALASRTGLEVALRHLVDNACDAMPDGGPVTVATRMLDGSSQVEVSVSDAGIGMSPDVVEHAFDPLFSTHPKGQTSGLGLTIVDRVTRTLGGSVLLESAAGSGTTVRLRLPGARDGG